MKVESHPRTLVWPFIKGLTQLGAILGIAMAVFVGSFFLHASKASPNGVKNTSDHVTRFGPPMAIYHVERDGRIYQEYVGQLPSGLSTLALPSAPPSYIYDENGRLVDWCADPGDSPSFGKKWPRVREVK